MKPEERWQDFDDVPGAAKPVPGVTIAEGMRVRDLPEWFRCCFVHHEGGYPDVRFANGSFVWLQWAFDPTGLERVTETVLVPGDALLAWPDGGVKVRFACPERERKAILERERAFRKLFEDYNKRRSDVDPEKRSPIHLLRLCQQAMLGKNVSYPFKNLEPHIGQEFDDRLWQVRNRALSERLGRRMVWC